MAGGKGRWRPIAGWAAGVTLLAWGQAGLAQMGAVATARSESRGAVKTPKVQAEEDAGLAGETPLNTQHVSDPMDSSKDGTPVGTMRAGGWIKANTPLKVQLTDRADSGAQRNGDTVMGVLLEPVRVSNGTVLKAGTPVKATVLASAKAGQLQSGGVLSLQVFQVGKFPVTSDVLEFSGQEGKRDVADSNPEKGTEAMVQPGSALSFQVMGSGDKADPADPRRQGRVPASGTADAAPTSGLTQSAGPQT